MVRADIHTDDYVFDIEGFDVTAWFEEADDDEILDLAACGWGGDYASDAVAEYFDKSNTEIGEMFSYLSRIQGTERACGFECRVDSEDAIKWIDENRPHLVIN